MIIEILSRTPVWVWGLLAALLALGMAQSRDRQVPPARLLILPIALLALGLSATAAGFVALPASAALWLLALAAGVALGLRRPPPAGTHWLPAEHRLHLPGSWLPMGLIVAIFSLRYGANVGMAINPALRNAPAVLLPLALLYGALSGTFLGRALGLFRLTRPVRAVSGHASPA